MSAVVRICFRHGRQRVLRDCGLDAVRRRWLCPDCDHDRAEAFERMLARAWAAQADPTPAPPEVPHAGRR